MAFGSSYPPCPWRGELIETPADDVLDRLAKTAGADEAHAPAETEAPIEADGHGEALPRVRWRGLRRVGGWLRRALQFFTAQSSSSVTRRIVSLNVAGLLGAVDRHHLSVAVPRRPDRRAHSKFAGAEPDHRRRDRRLGDGRDRFLDHHQSGHAAQPAARPKLRPVRGCALRHRFSDQSRARGADLEAPDFADQDAGADLRPRRRALGRQPQPVRPRRHFAFRLAAADCRQARRVRARLPCGAALARPRRPAALSRARRRKRQGLFRSRPGA